MKTLLTVIACIIISAVSAKPTAVRPAHQIKPVAISKAVHPKPIVKPRPHIQLYGPRIIRPLPPPPPPPRPVFTHPIVIPAVMPQNTFGYWVKPVTVIKLPYSTIVIR